AAIRFITVPCTWLVRAFLAEAWAANGGGCPCRLSPWRHPLRPSVLRVCRGRVAGAPGLLRQLRRRPCRWLARAAYPSPGHHHGSVLNRIRGRIPPATRSERTSRSQAANRSRHGLRLKGEPSPFAADSSARSRNQFRSALRVSSLESVCLHFPCIVGSPAELLGTQGGRGGRGELLGLPG